MFMNISKGLHEPDRYPHLNRPEQQTEKATITMTFDIPEKENWERLGMGIGGVGWAGGLEDRITQSSVSQEQ